MKDKTRKAGLTLIEITFWSTLLLMSILCITYENIYSIREAVVNMTLNTLFVVLIFYTPIISKVLLGDFPFYYLFKKRQSMISKVKGKTIQTDELFILRAEKIQKQGERIYAYGVMYFIFGVIAIISGIVLLSFNTAEIIRNPKQIGTFEVIQLVQRLSIAILIEVIGIFLIKIQRELLSKDYAITRREELCYLDELLVYSMTQETGKEVDEDLKKHLLREHRMVPDTYQDKKNTNKIIKQLTKLLELFSSFRK